MERDSAAPIADKKMYMAQAETMGVPPDVAEREFDARFGDPITRVIETALDSVGMDYVRHAPPEPYQFHLPDFDMHIAVGDAPRPPKGGPRLSILTVSTLPAAHFFATALLRAHGVKG